MKKAICMLLAACLTSVLFSGCSSGSPERTQEASTEEISTEISYEKSAESESSTATNDYADMVVYGTIFTAENEGNETVEAFAVKDGKYVCVGSKTDVAPYVKEGVTKVIDKTGKGLIIPGCTEGHGHFVGIDALARALPGFGCSYDELLKVLKEEVSKDKKPDFFVSWGFDPITFIAGMDPEKSYAEEIESIAPGIPVIFIDGSGHQALCNTTVLKDIGFYDGKTIRGGSILLNDNNQPSGLLSDEVVPYAIEKCCDFSALGDEVFQEACETAIDTLHKRGFTNYFDAYLNYLSEEFYKHIKNMDDAGKLTVNMSSCQSVRSFESEQYKETIDHAKKLADEYNSEHFNPYNIKLFADGVFETKTGWILGEYPDVEKGQEHGNIVWQPEELEELVKYANSTGLLVHTHAYGDAAVQAMIDAYLASNDKLGRKYHNTLGHVRNITDEDIKRAAENNIGIAANMIWHYNNTIDDENFDAIETAKSMMYPEGMWFVGYPIRSLTDAGILVSSSTDAPAGEKIEGNIFNIIEISTTGMEPEIPTRPYDAKELLSVREALMCLTINGARQLGIDDKCGSISCGKNADFIIVDTNFLDYKGDDLRTIHNSKIQKVYFEGKEVLSQD